MTRYSNSVSAVMLHDGVTIFRKKATAYILFGLVSLITCAVVVPSFVHADIPKHNPVPGGLAVVYLPFQSDVTQPNVRFGSRAVLVLQNGLQWYAIVGLSDDMIPGNYVLSISSEESPGGSQLFRVDPLPISKSRRVVELPNHFKTLTFESPDLNIQSLDLVQNPFEQPLVPNFNLMPVVKEGQYIPYGSMLSEKKKTAVINHPWVTYLTPPHTIVFSPGTAIVEQITQSDTSVITVVLNHGMGLRSVLFNLDDVIVEVGQRLEATSIIGATQTSSDTISRVDWQLILNNSPIDPLQFSPPS